MKTQMVREKLKTYVLGEKANLWKVVRNIMSDGRGKIDGKMIDEYEPNILNTGQVSSDQSEIISKQIGIDTQRKK
jgi:hypothetical protein